MYRRILRTLMLIGVLLASSLLLSAEPLQLSEPPDGSRLSLQTIVEGDLARPNYIVSAADGTNRLFLVQQVGIIRVIENGELLETPFLDVTALVPELTDYSEQGLIGLAFHPDYENNGRFFINYTDGETDGIQIVEYRVSADDPNVADPTTARVIMYNPNMSQDHNGGQLLFGPADGHLYIGIGDGIGPGDPNRVAQDMNSVHGKILRINVNDETVPYRLIRENPYIGTGRPEIWALGLRNPYSFSIDPVSGDMYIGDVGQDTWEEVNYIAGDDTDGANFGWSRLEGPDIYNRDVAASPDMEPAALAYQHSPTRCSVISGHVYRGEAFPELYGLYIFSDWCASALLALYKNENGLWESSVLLEFPEISGVTGIGLDEAGEMYLTYYNLETSLGGVMKVVPNS
ncbi:MAG: PQQ-dependent sugar dehydrogenase [Anaerolineae bacterium]|jgi:glucose/arabinose dehydrogenase|nr:PQQ-dependent sugar dehydrogenase [Anaerolineae bacterium]